MKITIKGVANIMSYILLFAIVFFITNYCALDHTWQYFVAGTLVGFYGYMRYLVGVGN